MKPANKKHNYDLEERTFQFAKKVSGYCKKLPHNASNVKYIDQVIRASSSPGANYIEANEALGKKDFMMKIRICRKESKESAYWLRLIVETNSKNLSEEGNLLRNEAIELKKIFSAILMNSEYSQAKI